MGILLAAVTEPATVADTAGWWSADFWQRVAISGLGTFGSAALAIGLFYLQRWYSNRDDKEKEAQAQQDKMRDAIVAAVNGFAEEASREQENTLSNEAGLWNAADRLFFALPRLRMGLEDKDLYELCYLYPVYLKSVLDYRTSGMQSGIKYDVIGFRARLMGVAQQTALQLAHYVNTGHKMDLSEFWEWNKEKKFPPMPKPLPYNGIVLDGQGSTALGWPDRKNVNSA